MNSLYQNGNCLNLLICCVLQFLLRVTLAVLAVPQGHKTLCEQSVIWTWMFYMATRILVAEACSSNIEWFLNRWKNNPHICWCWPRMFGLYRTTWKVATPYLKRLILSSQDRSLKSSCEHFHWSQMEMRTRNCVPLRLFKVHAFSNAFQLSCVYLKQLKNTGAENIRGRS